LSKPAEKSKKRRVGLLVSRVDGTIVEQNSASVALLGDAKGKSCWEIVSTRARGADLPCSPGCVHRIVDAEGEGTLSCKVIIDGLPHQLSCAAAGEQTTTVVAPLDPPRVDDGERELSSRELEVLQGLARGRTAPQIADALGITRATVRTHLEHLRAKLGATTQAALVAEGYERGYL
jgi:DNA-binding CsgD family transcriptional regulator